MASGYTTAACAGTTEVAMSQRSRTILFFFFSSRRRHTRFDCDWSSDVCSSDLANRLSDAERAKMANKCFIPNFQQRHVTMPVVERKLRLTRKAHSVANYNSPDRKSVV